MYLEICDASAGIRHPELGDGMITENAARSSEWGRIVLKEVDVLVCI